MFDLTGKTALVTGATGGIGAAIARALHGAGATVVLSGTRENVLEERVSELGAERALAVPANLADPDSVATLVPRAEEAAGKSIDILVNNAGITRDTLAMRMKPEQWQEVLDVNLTAAFRLSQAVLKGMMKARWGRIINITSVVALTGNPGQTNYAAAKAGMIGMSKSLAREVAARGITVNCIAPGFIETPMTDALNEKQREAILAQIPSGRLGTPEDVAAAALYLASPEAAYVTGHVLSVNGGMAMC
ncbi:3-oxoacyl-[acyl-carrier-protein] reductase [Thermopetrobacter sp. TC1]|uniref:3-oxoacyl-[acyl-carrier-protein] reductase n=1 Tax=Thermopetrobacter sp. TC1 TaxID=1495045 RepID=UPI000571141E|nr:3-oxoacyl-[acyl-carrier-protein] reductase [Thermopetrobacter sp. TC1]